MAEPESLTAYYRRKMISFGDIVTADPRLRACLETARRAAASDVTVLLLGENGTGKNLIAQAIHNASPRKKNRYVSVNCSAMTDSLLESELFGHEKGAFTGAERLRRGRFELADGGTLFLDEIADISAAAQAKILRAVEYKEFERVGGEETLRSDVRIIAATNRDLQAMVERGTFRIDFYYRVHEVVIHLPPLRERRGDIPLLVNAFIRECNAKYSKKVRGVHAVAMDYLVRHDWPGNIRELRNVVKRAVSLAEGDTLLLEDFPIGMVLPERAGRLAADASDLALESVERDHIRKVLDLTGGDKKRACELLKISRPTLDRKIRAYGLVVPRRGAEKAPAQPAG
jgi:transcriptional regulator with PAS, ATPase and Fis domain